MTSAEPSTPMTTYLCLFHSADHAERAVNALELAGLQHIVLVATDPGQSREGDYEVIRKDLLDLGTPPEDVEHLTEEVLRGGLVVALRAPEAHSAEIERIFGRFRAVKTDEAVLPAAAADVPGLSREDVTPAARVAQAMRPARPQPAPVEGVGGGVSDYEDERLRTQPDTSNPGNDGAWHAPYQTREPGR